MLSAGDLAAMRTVLEASLPDTCTISRASTVADGGGGFTETWATIATVSCRVGPMAGAEDLEGGQVSEEGRSVITVPHDTDVTESDRVVTGGVAYEVHHVRRRSWQLGARLDVSAAPS